MSTCQLVNVNWVNQSTDMQFSITQHHGSSIKDGFYYFWIQSSGDPADHINHNIVTFFLVFYFKIKLHESTEPLVTYGIQIGCWHYIGEQIIIHVNHKHLIW